MQPGPVNSMRSFPGLLLRGLVQISLVQISRPGLSEVRATIGGMSNDLSTPTIAPELLTSRQAAALAGVGERTWWRWSRCGLAPAPIKIGDGKRAAVRFRRSELLDWIAAGCPRCDGRPVG